MKLRTQLNLVISALSAAFVVVLIAAEVQSTRQSVREEIEAANRVASQLLGQLASVYSTIGGPDLVLEFVRQLGRVRANEVYLEAPSGEILYRSPAATYKAASRWWALRCWSS
jgi:two-component system sensor histidine kinase UhpB